MNEQFERVLRDEASHLKLAISETVAERLFEFYELLRRWNRRINLTALPLEQDPVRSIKRLLVEPLVGLQLVTSRPTRMLDIGSGSGSPAIPIALCRPDMDVTMIEAREKKAAFLREAGRLLQLEHVTVAVERFELQQASRLGSFDLVTVRGVRVDDDVSKAIAVVLAPRGYLVTFGSSSPSRFKVDHELSEDQGIGPIALYRHPFASDSASV